MITTSTKQDQQEINKELAISNGDLRLLPALEAALERLHINNIENWIAIQTLSKFVWCG